MHIVATSAGSVSTWSHEKSTCSVKVNINKVCIKGDPATTRLIRENSYCKGCADLFYPSVKPLNVDPGASGGALRVWLRCILEEVWTQKMMERLDSSSGSWVCCGGAGQGGSCDWTTKSSLLPKPQINDPTLKTRGYFMHLCIQPALITGMAFVAEPHTAWHQQPSVPILLIPSTVKGGTTVKSVQWSIWKNSAGKRSFVRGTWLSLRVILTCH